MLDMEKETLSLAVFASQCDLREVKEEHCLKASIEANRFARDLCALSPTLTKKKLPGFSPDEIYISKLLGSGGFGCVYALEDIVCTSNGDITLSPMPSKKKSLVLGPDETKPVERKISTASRGAAGNSNKEMRRQEFLAKFQKEKYAVKFLKVSTFAKSNKLLRGATDMMTETHFLSALQHPNIIKLHAVSQFGATGFAPQHGIVGGYFLILDRLFETLVGKLHAWHNQSQRSFMQRMARSLSKRGFNFSGNSNANDGTVVDSKTTFLLTRLDIAKSIADAITYLHSHNIVFRDLKPENIGFDGNGTVKLFDFGFALQLPSTDNNFVGTHPYVSPEIAIDQPKCKKCLYSNATDVYAFGILLWEMLSLQEPYPTVLQQDYFNQVMVGGLRPKMTIKRCPVGVQSLIPKCWETDPTKRPTMEYVLKCLEKEHDAIKKNGM